MGTSPTDGAAMARGDRYRSHHLPQVGADIAALRDIHLQRIALIRIGQLAAEEIRGRRLQELPSWPAELGNCWKLYFDLHEHARQAPKYRIVYRFLPPSDDPQSPDRRPRLQVLAVGPRKHAEAYERAAARLALPHVKIERPIQPHDRATEPRPDRSALTLGAARLAALARNSADASRDRAASLRPSFPPPPPPPLPAPQSLESTSQPPGRPIQPQQPPPRSPGPAGRSSL